MRTIHDGLCVCVFTPDYAYTHVTEADPNACDFSGSTPLHVAAGLGMSAIVSLLLAGGGCV